MTKPIIVPILLAILIIGYYSFSFPHLQLVFLLIGHISFALILIYRVRKGRLDPLIFFIGIGFFRFGIPGLLTLVTKPPSIWVFGFLGLRPVDWTNGHILAVLGLMSVIIGWIITPKIVLNPRKKVFYKLAVKNDLLSLTTITTFLLSGLSSLIIFIGLNTQWNIKDTILSGVFRTLIIVEGTGVYFWLSLLAIPSSVLISIIMYRRRKWMFMAMLPTVLVSLMLLILGGRARALSATLAGFISLWLIGARFKGRHFKVFAAICLACFVLIIAATGLSYRSGYGMSALSLLSFKSIYSYITLSTWSESAILYSLAAATKVGPGILHGQSFIGIMGPIAEWFGLSRETGAGIFVAETLMGPLPRRWGFHTSLIGDSYLNFGLFAVPLICALFGMWLRLFPKWLKRRFFNEPTLWSALYSLTLVLSMRVFFESIEKLFEMMVVLGYLLLIVVAINLSHSMLMVVRKRI